MVTDLGRLHSIEPRLAVHDLHPDYSTTHAAAAMRIPTMAVQHHLAHVAACVAEHGTMLPVLGVAWDGSGYGDNGMVWGGEFLLVGYSGWRRVACLRPFCLPGGEVAVREPRRAGVRHGERASQSASSSSNESTMRSAAETSVSANCGTAMTVRPAAFAAATPDAESSRASASAAATLSRSQARR